MALAAPEFVSGAVSAQGVGADGRCAAFVDDALAGGGGPPRCPPYMIKDVDTTGLVSSIRAVARNESVFDAWAASAMVRSIRITPQEPVSTGCEQNVLELPA